MKKNTICFVAGRSGGHLIPALTLVQQEKKKNTKTKVLFFSANTKLDKKIAGKAKTIDWHIPLSLENIPGKKLHHYPRFFLDFFNSFFSALHHLRTKKPNKIIQLIDQANVNKAMDIGRNLIILAGLVSAVALGVISLNPLVLIYVGLLTCSLIGHIIHLLQNYQIKKTLSETGEFPPWRSVIC